MAKRRSLWRKLSTSQRAGRLMSHKSGLGEFALLLYIQAIPWADDYGSLPADDFTLKTKVWPSSPRPFTDFAKARELLTAAQVEGSPPLWIAYKVGDKLFIYIDQFNDHQKGFHKHDSEYGIPCYESESQRQDTGEHPPVSEDTGEHPPVSEDTVRPRSEVKGSKDNNNDHLPLRGESSKQLTKVVRAIKADLVAIPTDTEKTQKAIQADLRQFGLEAVLAAVETAHEQEAGGACPKVFSYGYVTKILNNQDGQGEAEEEERPVSAMEVTEEMRANKRETELREAGAPMSKPYKKFMANVRKQLNGGKKRTADDRARTAT